MKHRALTTLVPALLLVSSIVATAQQGELPFAPSAAGVVLGPGVSADVQAKLQASFSRLPATEISTTPVKGMYEVLTDRQDILYFFPESGHLFSGQMWNYMGENLTMTRKNELASKKLATLPLDKALKIGNGPNKVIEVTDPDCPFCRKGSEFLDTKADQITRYIFFMPLTQLHPQAMKKAAYILSSSNPEQTYHDVFSGKYDKDPLPTFTDNGKLLDHQQVVTQLGVQGTPHYFINGKAVSGADTQQMEALINAGPTAKN